MTCCSPAATLVFFLAFLGAPTRRFLRRSNSLDLAYFDEKYHATIATHQIRKVTTTNTIASHLHDFVEQIRAQPDARAQQLFVELGTDSGGGETAHHLPVRIET